ncbi:MAG: MCP four helix bundle domain-containing protein, partial [Angelakisella sp.]
MLKNMKIAKKLIVSFIVAVLIASISGGVGLFLLNNVDTSYSVAMVSNGFVLGDIGNFNAYLQKGAAMARDVIMLTDPADIQTAQAEMDSATTKTNEAWAAAKAHCQTPDELVITEKMDAAAPLYLAARDKAVALGRQNKNDEALQVFIDEAKPYLDQCVTGGEE